MFWVVSGAISKIDLSGKSKQVNAVLNPDTLVNFFEESQKQMVGMIERRSQPLHHSSSASPSPSRNSSPFSWSST